MSISSWVTRTPAIRDILGVSTAEMGFILFGLSVGSMIGVLSSGALVARLGTQPVVLGGMIGIVLSTPAIGFGAATSSALTVCAGLVLFGLGMGCSEVAMNVEGVDVEATLGVTTLPPMHGFFSLGMLIGATIGLVLTAIDFPVAIHLLSIGIFAAVVMATSIRKIPSGVGRIQGCSRTKSHATALCKESKLLLLGLIVLAMAFSEGTANDWLPLLMVDGHGLTPSGGAAMYAVFAAAMALGRFLGAPVLTRFGRISTIRGSALVGGVGLILVIFPDNQLLAVIGVVLWGMGAALGFPVAISAAGESGPNEAARVASVSAAGYVAFLVGPPALGILGEHFGLRLATTVVLVLLVLAAIASAALGTATQIPATTTPDPARLPAEVWPPDDNQTLHETVRPVGGPTPDRRF
ncbi:MFS transporter [Paenarthrobacter sp. NPDC091669]|uniref:MFS transporter n=1 Tax=Paenarthrobacter sp. NPDC091669 TaxID=3364384 RepID=UPI003809B7E1